MRRYQRYPLPDGWRPDPALMQGAPIVEDWMLIADGEDVRVAGTLFGHPFGSDGKNILTAPVSILDAEHGWAICGTRAFRLGASLDDLETWKPP